MDKRTKEAIRYLGYGKHTVDVQTLAMISDSFYELENYAEPKHVYRIFAINFKNEQCFTIGINEFNSRHLCKNLKGCHKVIVFAATLGIRVDRYMRMVSLDDMAKAVVLQACSAALLEEYCDNCQRQFADNLSEEQLYIRPRFSPGYGDFSIRYQKPFLEMLQTDKTIGLTMTDSYMLTPTKSVTAIMGISTMEDHCHIQGCEVCEKKDCMYRRDS